MKKIALVIMSLLIAGFFSLNGQSLNLKIGAFYPNMESDLWEINRENLAFDKADMLGVYLGAEFEIFMGRQFSLALEAGHYKKDIFTVYKDVVYDDGTPIYQDLSLRMTTIEADFKLYPLGHRRLFNPYIGCGIGLYVWKYYQGGEFVDFEDETVYEGEAYTNTITPGFNAKLGFVYRYRRTFGISFEARYIYVKGQLSSLFEGFEKLDLSSVTLSIGVHLFLR
jgi:hypothetical protein